MCTVIGILDVCAYDGAHRMASSNIGLIIKVISAHFKTVGGCTYEGREVDNTKITRAFNNKIVIDYGAHSSSR